MFIIELTYVKDVSEADQHMDGHIAFVEKYFDQNIFIASGRKVPRNGGVILATCNSRDDVEKIITEDPFHQFGIAKFDVTEFVVSRTRKGLEALKSC